MSDDGSQARVVHSDILIADEDRARADLYAVLGRLWYEAPDEALLAALAASRDSFGGEGHTLGRAWNGLARAAAAADAGALKLEYDAVFVGTGKAEVTPYASFYITPAGRERIVVALRDELRDLGLARIGRSHEPEDHIAALCEVMRALCSAGSDDASISRQKAFFMRYIGRAYMPFTDAVLAAPVTAFYRAVAALTKAFCDVESQSFEMI